jgi:hypothetical protein
VIGIDFEGKFVEGTIKDRTTAALKLAEARLALVGLDLSDGTCRPSSLSATSQ